MPAHEGRYRYQKAVLWPAEAEPDQYGRAIVGDPVEIRVRWINQLGWMDDPKGNTVPVDAKVHVDRAVPVGSQMWLGSLSSFVGSGSGVDDGGIMYVVAYKVTPSIKNRANRRMLGLQRFRDEVAD